MGERVKRAYDPARGRVSIYLTKTWQPSIGERRMYSGGHRASYCHGLLDHASKQENKLANKKKFNKARQSSCIWTIYRGQLPGGVQVKQ